MDDESFEEAFQLAGWLLAHQASLAAGGEVPLPLVIFALDDQETAQLLAPRTDSDSYERQVLAGRVVLGTQSSQFRSWAFAYDEDLDLAGRVLYLEIGGQDFRHAVTLAQRYAAGKGDGNGDGFRLVGDLEVIGQELLPLDMQERLESCRWRYRVTEGATNHEAAGERWQRWYSARDHERTWLSMGGVKFAVPEGWVFRRTEEGGGWLVLRLLPWDERRREPTIMILPVAAQGYPTLESVLAKKKAELSDYAAECLKAEIGELPAHPLFPRAARISWAGEEEGRRYRTEWVWLPTAEPEEFLVLCATSFQAESWESLGEALEAVLGSLALDGD